MTYNKTNWVSGETLLSAENFNKIEKGIEDAHIAASNIQNTLNNVNNDAASIKASIATLSSDIATLKQTVNNLTEIVEELLNNTEPPLGDDVPDTLPKLTTPVIFLEEESLPEAPESTSTTSILGEAVLGQMILGSGISEQLPKLSTPTIYLEITETPETPQEPETIKSYIFSISPTPSNAVVTLTSEGAVQQGNSIEVKEGSTVQWKVELSGYETQEGLETINSSTTKEISLVYIKPKLNTPEIYLETIKEILETPIIYLENI